MVKRAEDFYRSLGFPALPREFWERSSFERNSSEGNCHATATNMWEKNDFRILACLDVNAEDFYVIHHEMGHVQYYRAYEKQPTIFRVKINIPRHKKYR